LIKYKRNTDKMYAHILKILGTTGMITGVLGASLIALNTNLFVLGYISFLLSSISWVIYAMISNQKNLFVLNIVFTGINLMGLVNFL